MGYSSNELIEKNFNIIYPTLPKEIGKKIIGQESILSDDNHLKLDTFHQTKEGKKIPVVIIVKLYQPTDNERFIIVSVELVDNDEIPNKNKIEYFKNTCDFHFVLDKNGIIDYMSPSVQYFFGFPQEAVVGRNYFECVAIGKRKESKELFEHFFKLEIPYRTEDTACLSTDGKTIYTELFFTPDYNDAGKFVGYRVLVWATKKS